MSERWCHFALCSLGLSVTASGVTPGPLPPAADQQLARSIFKELVEIRTTHDRGATEAARGSTLTRLSTACA
ncbi:MAG TPA: hypothetical protein VMT66_18280 [Steroidobacteraceae bacterium]|nr:hypothetical protein [Steroidobacteraceae bacterium]